MAEMMKNTNMGTNAENMTSRVQSTVGHVSDRMTGVAHDVVETIQDNRPLMFIGIGLLAIGAGFGIWALVRGMRSEMLENRTPYSSDFGREDYRRSSQY